MDEQILKQIIQAYEQKQKNYDPKKDAPWVRRKEFEIMWSIVDPHISRDISVLKVCTSDTVFEHRKQLVEYFHNIHRLSKEVSETWIIFLTARHLGTDVLKNGQIDGLRFFDDQQKTVAPAENPEMGYKAMQANIDNGRPYVNLHIGSSATKQDTLWFIERYWDTYVSPKVENTAFPGRITSQSLRKLIIGRLKAQGASTKTIAAFVEDVFGEVLDETTYKKKSPKPTYEQDIFFEARAQLGSSLGEVTNFDEGKFKLEVDKTNHNHFLLIE